MLLVEAYQQVGVNMLDAIKIVDAIGADQTEVSANGKQQDATPIPDERDNDAALAALERMMSGL